MATYKLTNWSTTKNEHPWYPPECMALRLMGMRDDGHSVVTSPIVKVRGRRITTESGSVYILTGDPDPRFVAYCESIGKPLNLKRPIKVIK